MLFTSRKDYRFKCWNLRTILCSFRSSVPHFVWKYSNLSVGPLIRTLHHMAFREDSIHLITKYIHLYATVKKRPRPFTWAPWPTANRGTLFTYLSANRPAKHFFFTLTSANRFMKCGNLSVVPITLMLCKTCDVKSEINLMPETRGNCHFLVTPVCFVGYMHYCWYVAFIVQDFRRQDTLCFPLTMLWSQLRLESQLLSRTFLLTMSC